MRGGGLEGFWQRAGGDQCRFVDEAFAAVAKDYDRLVRLSSCGLNRGWRRSCVEACDVARGGWILDCATGTGELALLEFLRPPPGAVSWVALGYLRWLVPPLAGLLAWSRAPWTLATYLPRTIEAGPSVPELVEAVEGAGLRVTLVNSLFAQVVWLVVAMKPPRRLGETVKR